MKELDGDGRRRKRQAKCSHFRSVQFRSVLEAQQPMSELGGLYSFINTFEGSKEPQLRLRQLTLAAFGLPSSEKKPIE